MELFRLRTGGIRYLLSQPQDKIAGNVSTCRVVRIIFFLARPTPPDNAGVVLLDRLCFRCHNAKVVSREVMVMGYLHSHLLPSKEEALPGRAEPMAVPARHWVNGQPLKPPFPDHLATIYFGLGCFWGAERLFWQLPGVFVTAVGYAGGHTPNPTYEEVCTGRTGHGEIVMVVYDPAKITVHELLTQFWQSHDPTQGMRQGNDIGSQYRSVIYTTTDEQLGLALSTRTSFAKAVQQQGYSEITTEIGSAPPFYYAESYHQQYLAKNPGGYCGLKGTGVCLAGDSG